MRIAFVGKGGSGKSSVSWLVSSVLAESGKRVLAVDADHNMDLAHILGVTVDDSFPTLHRAHEHFRAVVNQAEDRQWHNIVLDGRPLPHFTLSPKDTFTQAVTKEISPRLDLMVVGLGAADVLFSSRCAHGHSAPLKYYLPLLTLAQDEHCVIDGVAGVDMMNFGLFTGADAIVVVVEPHQNSIRVYREVARIAQQSNLPVFAIINKSRMNDVRSALVSELGDQLLGELPLDTGVIEYDFANVADVLKQTIQRAVQQLEQSVPSTTGLERLRAFESAKQGQQVSV